MSPSADELAGLNAEVAAAKEESAQWRDRFLRKAAELENFRKRTERDRVEAVIVAKSAVLTINSDDPDTAQKSIRITLKGTGG